MDRDTVQAETGARLTAWMRTGFVLLVLVVAVLAVWTAGDFRRAARLFPQYAGGALVILCVLELARQVLRRAVLSPGAGALNTADIGLEEAERTPEGLLRSLKVLGWVLGFLVLIALIGLPLATLVFVPAILWARFRAPLWIAAALVAGLWGLMLALQLALAMRLPAGVLTGAFPF
jgi:hypothetical protein